LVIPLSSLSNSFTRACLGTHLSAQFHCLRKQRPVNLQTMRGKLLLWARRTHLYLGVFFSPLLLMFILTGWWQTMSSDDEKEREGGFIHDLIKKFSNVHTDNEWPRAGAHNHVWMMKWFVVSMCVALILLIMLGLFLSLQMTKSKWRVILAFFLGILIPAVLAYIA